ncbi:MAG: aminotransferase class IV [Deltaproteobacteria bacterium]|nr:aminotransferase class IV [Deltaproteobacteria bacterium]
MTAISIDGVLVDAEHATISVLDRGLLYGDGLFEVLRTWGGVAVDLGAHLDRLFASATALALRTIERTTLAAAVERTVAAAGEGEHRIRIVVTRGPGALGATTHTLGPGRAIVIVEPLGELPDRISAAIVDWPLPLRAGPMHKTLAYLDHIIARDLARAAGADEAIRLDVEGQAVEGSTSTLYAVSGDTILTAPTTAGILPGIVRGRVIAISERLGIVVREAAIAIEELRAADEIFVSSSLRGVVPVTRLDGAPVAAGPVTARIAAGLRDEMFALGRHHGPG